MPAARAQNATWNGTTGSFDAQGNWSPAAVPTGTASFARAGFPDITYVAKTTQGGFTSVLGDANAGTLAYNLGGVAAGADYRPDPRVLLGIGYVTGSQWVNGFDSRGTTDSFGASLYASFVAADFHVDALVGYASATNRLTRAIVLPGLATRTASGQASASQFLGQAETGYGIALSPGLSLTPFARLQGATTSRPGFVESGAGSLNLLVASESTNSLRSTLGKRGVPSAARDFSLCGQRPLRFSAR